MILALYASQKALQDYAVSSWHERLNIMTRYFEEELPIVVEEMKKKLEDERNELKNTNAKSRNE